MTTSSEALIALLKEQGWEEGEQPFMGNAYERLKVEHRVRNVLHISHWSRFLG